jgi:uncharacterized protein YndB with AHSA1/START domain
VRAQAERELLAPLEDVWAFLAEPYNLSDWWPGLAAVRPDRRGFARGARWEIVRNRDATLLRRPSSTGPLVVTAVEPGQRFAFQLSEERIAADLALEARGRDRTVATLSVEGPFLVGTRRALPRQALRRLYDLCQTAAEQ